MQLNSAAEMQAFAADVAREVRGGEVLLLFGELGAGKTTFVQGLARALGVAEPITSPTYTIVGEYAVAPPLTTLVHADLYRLDENTAASDPAIQDVLERAGEAGRLTVIEWADRLGEAAPAAARRIHFQHGERPDERVVKYNFELTKEA